MTHLQRLPVVVPPVPLALTARRPKVFLYSHDTFGLGHLRRNLAIASALLEGPAPFQVSLLTGSPVIDSWRLPRGLTVQPLPPVVKTGAETYAARDPGACFPLVKGYREALILKLVLRHRPDILLVDHAPAGMNGELLATLALIRRELPATRAVLGLRDILDAPEAVAEIWRAQDIHSLLDHAYDDILVYGARRMFDVAEAYGLSAKAAAKLRYTGYVVGSPAGGTRAVCWNPARAGGRPVVLVTAGGGGDGFALMEAYLAALRQLPTNSVHSVILTGPLMAPEQATALRAAAARRPDIELVERTTDLLPSLAAADAVVAMAGYNTSVELIACRARALLVPRAAPRAEQRMRAELLAGLGLAVHVPPGESLAERLAAALPALLAAPRPDGSGIDLNGASRVREFLAGRSLALLAGRAA
ncbi:MAG: glycosyltransferase family protein [Acetobacteraceae bacterium]